MCLGLSVDLGRMPIRWYADRTHLLPSRCCGNHLWHPGSRNVLLVDGAMESLPESLRLRTGNTVLVIAAMQEGGHMFIRLHREWLCCFDFP